MAYTVIDKPSDYFNTVLYTGNGSTQSITGVNFQPDWVWLKQRSGTSNHRCYDIVRGATKQIYPNLTNAENTETNGLTSFNSDGFSLGNEGGHNQNGQTFASWNWKAGTAFTNDASATGIGSIDSVGSVNTDAGFSIVTWTPTDTSYPQTIGHSLGVKPNVMIVKNRSRAGTDWRVYHSSLGATKALNLNTTSAQIDDNGFWNDVEPSSTVFTTGNGYGFTTGGATDNYVAYCFAEVKGYSKFGSYIGTGSSTGTPFIYTGFKPAFVMTKISSGTTDDWTMTDIVRDNAVGGGGNGTGARLQANYNGAEAVNTTYASIQKYSNGFSPQGNLNVTNGSGYTYIYMAFAENPLVGTNNVPATAR